MSAVSGSVVMLTKSYLKKSFVRLVRPEGLGSKDRMRMSGCSLLLPSPSSKTASRPGIDIASPNYIRADWRPFGCA